MEICEMKQTETVFLYTLQCTVAWLFWWLTVLGPNICLLDLTKRRADILKYIYIANGFFDIFHTSSLALHHLLKLQMDSLMFFIPSHWPLHHLL